MKSRIERNAPPIALGVCAFGLFKWSVDIGWKVRQGKLSPDSLKNSLSILGFMASPALFLLAVGLFLDANDAPLEGQSITFK